MPPASSVMRKRVVMPTARPKKLGATKLSEMPDATADLISRTSGVGFPHAMRRSIRQFDCVANLNNTQLPSLKQAEPTKPKDSSQARRHPRCVPAKHLVAASFFRHLQRLRTADAISRFATAPVTRSWHARDPSQTLTSVASHSNHTGNIEATDRGVSNHPGQGAGAGCWYVPRV
jgi:hypothetical protein